MKIVYESCAGHTKEYAQMLGKELNLPVESLKNYKQDYKEVIYLGWVMAGMIKGYSKIKNKAKLAAVIAVGLLPDKEEEIIKNNNVTSRFYFLPGGVDYSKLRWLKRNLLEIRRARHTGCFFGCQNVWRIASPKACRNQYL